ncbi:MAG: adenylyltransferase [Candidatus Dependentiae bacterium]|nr:adenylyltransferase [Candidatus Dependentiae bacterium]
MERLYAPWRSLYVKKDKESDECPFCVAAASSDDAAHLVLSRAGGVLTMLNRFPYNTGHLLIIPPSHVADLEVIPSEVRAGMMEAAATWSTVLKKQFNCHGFNIGFNLGAVAGGSIPGHIHMHVVPRWQGDTNFLATIGETKLISSDLADIYKQLLATTK